MFEMGTSCCSISSAKREKIPIRPGSCSINDSLDFPGQFPQIKKIEKQKMGRENDRVILHTNSDKNDSMPRINLMLIQEGENTALYLS